MTAPLYAKVKEHILQHIRSGAWTPGTRVPSENELVGHFSISRMTANRALRELTADGFLSRVPGVGTFVKEPTARSSLVELRNIAEEIAQRGHAYAAHIEKRETIEASPALADEFEMKVPSKLFHLVMVHTENGVPVQLEERYVNPFAAPHFNDQDFAKVTPTAYLVAALPVDELEHTVEAIMPTPEQQVLLDIGDDEPCLALHRRSWSKGHVVTVATLIYPASRHALYSRYKTSPSGKLSQ
jgi:GntR family transcriptional regulator, histidine utilization repressor